VTYWPIYESLQDIDARWLWPQDDTPAVAMRVAEAILSEERP
jgi:hypothetical protein